MSAFPSSLDSFIGFVSTHTLQADQHASQHNLEQGAIVAVETKVGTGASTPTNNTVLRGNGVGTTTYDQVHLATDVSGVLPVNNGGTGTGTSTGTGNVVLSNSPTTNNEILTGQPTISDFTNALHNHQNAVGGGTLNATNALQAGSVSFANLLSTIFSGQVTTYTNTGTAGGTNSFFYINLGGIKLLWGETAVQLSSAAGGNWALTPPASFFSSIQSVLVSAIDMVTDSRQYISINSKSTSSISMTFICPTGNASTAASIVVMGS